MSSLGTIRACQRELPTGDAHRQADMKIKSPGGDQGPWGIYEASALQAEVSCSISSAASSIGWEAASEDAALWGPLAGALQGTWEEIKLGDARGVAGIKAVRSQGRRDPVLQRWGVV